MKNKRYQRKITGALEQPCETGTNCTRGSLGKSFAEYLDIFLLFLITRGILTIIGVLALTFHKRQCEGRLEWEHPSYRWLDVWGQWDTGWYLDIAKNWYSASPHFQNYANYAFFPLYPTLIKLVGYLIGSHFIAGLILSNAALLGAAVLLYKLVLIDHDREVALNSVKYLFIWPTSFLLSGVLSEGLFLLLLVACFYQMRKQAWLNASMTGLLLSLTRVIGICITLPLLYEYMKARKFSLRAIKPDILALILVPTGLLMFCLYNYVLTGDFLAFASIQSAWGKHLVNPLTTMLYAMAGMQTSLRNIFSAWFTFCTLAILIAYYRKVPLPQMLFCMLAIFIPLSSGLLLTSMPRFLSVLFPIFILLAQLGKDRKTDMALMVFFAILQGCLMFLWSFGSGFIV